MVWNRELQEHANRGGAEPPVAGIYNQACSPTSPINKYITVTFTSHYDISGLCRTKHFYIHSICKACRHDHRQTIIWAHRWQGANLRTLRWLPLWRSHNPRTRTTSPCRPHRWTNCSRHQLCRRGERNTTYHWWVFGLFNSCHLQHITAGALCELDNNGQLEMAPAQLISIIITAEDRQGLNRERTVEVEVRARTVELPGLFPTAEELFEDWDSYDTYSDYMESRD